MKRYLNAYAAVCAAIMIFILGINASAAELPDGIVSETAEYIYKTVPEPQVGSVGGEWAIIGLARSGAVLPQEYYEKYYDSLLQYLREHDGILHSRKNTEYSRVIIALTAIGKDPSDVGGYNLLMPLGDYERTAAQGINGIIWALAALDCGGYEIPQNPSTQVQATRDMYIDGILKARLENGGWSLAGNAPDVDITAMAVQVLARYKDRAEVASAITEALSYISKAQDFDGGFSGGAENSVQVIIALCSMGIPLDDARFVKNGKNLFDGLMSYGSGKDGFRHEKDGETNQMTSEQALCALAALERFSNGSAALYDMTDSGSTSAEDTREILLDIKDFALKSGYVHMFFDMFGKARLI